MSSSLKNRLVKLEQGKKPAVCLVCLLEDVADADLPEAELRYCRENSLKRSDIVFLGKGDMEL
jgi:hypothetical protein